MKLEPIVMIHGGSISDTTPMSMSQACNTAPLIVPASQKTTQRTKMSVGCRASFIAAPERSVPGYTLDMSPTVFGQADEENKKPYFLLRRITTRLALMR